MRWKAKRLPRNRERIPPERVRLWCPRRIGNHWYWLEVVEREGYYFCIPESGLVEKMWTYRSLRDK